MGTMGDRQVLAKRDDRSEVELRRALGLVEQAASMGYLEGRVLPDGSVAMLGELMFTRAIYLGVNEEGWEFRFCFADRALAKQRFDELMSGSDEPQGFVARRFG